MPNTRVYPQHSEESLRSAVEGAFNDTFFSRPPAEAQELMEYYQQKIADLFRLPRRFIGLTEEELAANDDYQQCLLRRAEREHERQSNARRYQRFIDEIRGQISIPLPTGVLYYFDYKYTVTKKPLSGGFEFKLRPLNFGITSIPL